MKKNLFIVLWVVVLVVVYVLLINIYASIISADFSFGGESNMKYETGEVVLGLGDQVEVSVTRNRFYGTFVEKSSKESKSVTLYLLNFISLPLRVEGKNLFLVHLISLIVVFFILYKLTKWKGRRDYERGFI